MARPSDLCCERAKLVEHKFRTPDARTEMFTGQTFNCRVWVGSLAREGSGPHVSEAREHKPSPPRNPHPPPAHQPEAPTWSGFGQLGAGSDKVSAISARLVADWVEGWSISTRYRLEQSLRGFDHMLPDSTVLGVAPAKCAMRSTNCRLDSADSEVVLPSFGCCRPNSKRA